MMTVDLELLASFAAVVESGSFTRAADLLNTTQSNISAKVRKLEEQVGRSLISRTTRDMALTIDGEAMLGFARQFSGVRERLAEHFGGRGAGPVRVGLVEEIDAGGRIPKALKEFRRHYPLGHVELQTGAESDLMAALRTGRLDLAVTRSAGPDGKGELFWSEPLVWAQAPDFEIDPQRKLNIAMLPEPGPYREPAIHSLRGSGLDWELAFTSPNLLTLRAIAASGLAVTPLPRSLLEGGVVAVDRALLHMDARLGIYLHRGRSLTPAAGALGDILGDITPSSPASITLNHLKSIR